MFAQWGIRLLAFVALAMLVLAGLSPRSSSASVQASDATLLSSVLFVYQGENPFNSDAVSNQDFYALRIMSFTLPYDVVRVYTRVPSNTQNITVWSGSIFLNESQFGTEPVGPHAGQFYIDVPSSHPRTANYTNTTSSEAAFNASGSAFTNTVYSSGALRLVNDSPSGQYISPEIAVPSSIAVLSATLILNGNSTSNITSYLSNDAGLNWTQCQNNTALNFTSEGTTLRIMFDMTGNLTLGNDTAITSFQIVARYTSPTTVFTVHVSYVWRSEFSHGRTTVDLSEALPFSSGGTYLIMLYLSLGYTPSAAGVVLEFDKNRTVNTYADKNLYFNTSVPSGVPSYSVDVISPEAESNVLLYSAAVLLVLVFAAAFAYSRKKKPRVRATREESGREEPPVELAGADDDRRKELVLRKKAILSEIEGIRKKLASGEMPRDAAEAELPRLRKEFKSVRNELNRLSRKATPKEVSSPEPSEYGSILAALAKIDQDYEKGRLPENSYKTIRKDYVQRAAKVMAARKDEVQAPMSPLEQERSKLMEAIVILDEEREKGEIDEKVYLDLRASYRKQLVELVKKVEE